MQNFSEFSRCTSVATSKILKTLLRKIGFVLHLVLFETEVNSLIKKMISSFLPVKFDKTRPVAIIAGQGIYPLLIYERLQKLKIPARLVAFEGETSRELLTMVPKIYQETIKVGQLGHLLKALKKMEVTSALMAGQITPKRLFKGLKLDLKATIVLGRLKTRNAETIFGAIAKEIEKMGVQMLDARAFIEDQLAEDNVMVGKLKISDDYINHAIDVAKKIAQLDIGQGVVARKGTILAVEGFEGTDSMLRRAGEFEASEAFFIKTVKWNQDYRFDVPVFGLKTLEVMAESGIFVAGLEAGKTIILEKAKVLKEAKQHKITLFGYSLSSNNDA